MANGDQFAGLVSRPKVSGVLQSVILWRSLLVLLLTLVISQGSIGFSQSASATPAKANHEVNQPPGSPSKTDDESSASPAPSEPQAGEKAEPKKEKRGSLVIAPIPISSPAFGAGLILVAGYVFRLNLQDEKSPPSFLGATGAFTNNGTRALLLGGKLYAKENKYQTTFALGKGRANLDFFGIGRIPGRPPISVPLSMSGTIFFGEGMRNIGKNIFVGPRFQYRRLSTGIDGDPVEGGFEIPDIDLKSTSAALGFHVQRDLRDNTFYPTRGTLFDFTADFFDQVWGSRREYQTYKVSYNGYRKVGDRQVLAYRAMACSANGSVPFYDLCLFGFSNDLRGY